MGTETAPSPKRIKLDDNSARAEPGSDAPLDQPTVAPSTETEVQEGEQAAVVTAVVSRPYCTETVQLIPEQ